MLMLKGEGGKSAPLSGDMLFAEVKRLPEGHPARFLQKKKERALNGVTADEKEGRRRVSYKDETRECCSGSVKSIFRHWLGRKKKVSSL